MSLALTFAVIAALLLGGSDFFAARSALTTPSLTVTRTGSDAPLFSRLIRVACAAVGRPGTTRKLNAAGPAVSRAGGVTVSYYEWVQNKRSESWTEEEVDAKLEAWSKASNPFFAGDHSDLLSLLPFALLAIWLLRVGSRDAGPKAA